MKVKLTRDTLVRILANSTIEVTDEEGKRLIAFGNAVEYVAPKKKETKKQGASK